jgi:hypothetical protein
VRAYYASQSATEGNYDGTQVSNDIAQKAFSTILGAVVTRHGTSVLAPWGMEEDQFLDKAKVAFDIETARVGVKNTKFADVGLQMVAIASRLLSSR